jgi:hypothetical protein
MLTVLTQTPPFISGNRACEPGFAGVGALATFPNLPGRNDFVFVPALVLAGAPSGALPTSCRRLLGEGSAKTILSKLLKEIADRAAGAAWSSAMSRAAPSFGGAGGGPVPRKVGLRDSLPHRLKRIEGFRSPTLV